MSSSYRDQLWQFYTCHGIIDFLQIDNNTPLEAEQALLYSIAVETLLCQIHYPALLSAEVGPHLAEVEIGSESSVFTLQYSLSQSIPDGYNLVIYERKIATPDQPPTFLYHAILSRTSTDVVALILDKLSERFPIDQILENTNKRLNNLLEHVSQMSWQ